MCHARLRQTIGAYSMRKSKVPSLFNRIITDFSLDQVQEMAVWISTTFDDLHRIEIFQLSTDASFVLVLVSDDNDSRKIFAEYSKSSSFDGSDPQKRFNGMSTVFKSLGKDLSGSEMGTNSPHVDILFFPSDWRKLLSKMAKEYTVPNKYMETRAYFASLASLEPVEVL